MKDFKEVLEYNLVVKKLVDEASTSYGKELASNIALIYDKLTLIDELEKTDEAMRIIYRIGALPLSGIHNVTSYLNLLGKRGLLGIEEIYRIGVNIDFASSIKRFEGQLTIKDTPHFSAYANSLSLYPTIKKKIDQCITPNLDIADSATPRLGKIRQQIKNLEGEIKNKLESYVSKKSEYLSDTIVTTRNDRLVIPVKSSFKYAISGIIHDESDSKQTAFIEPDFAIELNAKLTRLRFDEHEEIIIVLRMLGDLLYSELAGLQRNEQIFAELDFIFAKGKLGVKMKGQIGQIVDEQLLELHKVRHPLLDPKTVIANDILLGGNYHSIMLVSGPNTGGKTVLLKSAGLMALMHQSGLAIPVDGIARLGIFKNFFVDIGDEQSIEQSLSSFSSHIKKLIEFLNSIDSHSLILLDELGGGTDPLEGEALAMAIIEEIHRRNAMLIVTTHYSNLKTFAIDSNYITNASMLFDKESITPLYKIVMNIPGRSYAMEISSRLGMSPKMIERANYFKDHYSGETTRLIEKLEGELLISQDKLNELLLREDQLVKLEAEYQNKLKETERQNKRIQEEADLKISEIVLQAELQVEAIIDELKNKPQVKMHEWIESKRKLAELIQTEEEQVEDTITLNPGDYVKVKNLNKIGQVIRLHGEKAQVKVGAMTLSINTAELSKTKKIEEEPITFSKKTGGLKTVKYEINVIGLRVEEALLEVEKHLDDALSAHLKSIRIVHGFGTGALRKAIHQYLDKCSFVSDYRLGGPGEGSGGATIVNFK